MLYKAQVSHLWIRSLLAAHEKGVAKTADTEIFCFCQGYKNCRQILDKTLRQGLTKKLTLQYVYYFIVSILSSTDKNLFVGLFM